MRAARRIPLPWLLIGSSAAAGVAVAGGLQLLDQSAVRLVSQLREPLQASLSSSLGHAVEFGPYRGLRPWGFAVGPSEARSTAQDPSSLHLDELQVRFNPMASLRQWRPVVELHLQGLEARLHRQDDGRFWRFGTPSASAEPLPDMDLRFVFPSPARVELVTTGERLLLESRGSVQLRQARFAGVGRLRWADRKGGVQVDVDGRWAQPELALTTRLDDLDLSRLVPLIPLPQGLAVSGTARGDLGVQWRAGELKCHGALRLNQLELRGGPLPQSLQSSEVGFDCLKDRLVVRPSAFRSGSWRARTAGVVRLSRSLDLRVDLSADGTKDRLTLALDGPWSNPRWLVDGRLSVPQWPEPLQLKGAFRTPWLDPERRFIQVTDARLEAPGLRVQLAGRLGRNSDLRSRELRLSAPLWQSQPALKRILGEAAPLTGQLRLTGPFIAPDLTLELQQGRNLLLQDWRLRAGWSLSEGRLALDRFESPLLQASAELPLNWREGAVQLGDLQAEFALQPFPLARLSSLMGMPVTGQLSASGRVDGPLSALKPDVRLDLQSPGVGPLRFSELWLGQLSGELGSGLELDLFSTDGSLQLQGAGVPLALQLRRGAGRASLNQAADGGLTWRAEQLPLDGTQLMLPFTSYWQAMRGQLSGEGRWAGFDRRPNRRLNGSIRLEALALQGIGLQQVDLEGGLIGDRFDFTGRVMPDQGELTLHGSGRLDAAVRGRVEAKGLDVPWLLRAARQLRGGSDDGGFGFGQASDLGALVINTFGGSLDGHLRALANARRALAPEGEEEARSPFDPDDLQGRLDAVIDLDGPRLSALAVDGEARAHLWLDGGDRDRMLQMEPVVVRVDGALQGGTGSFSLLHLPFALLGLLAPVPSALRGAIGLTGRYDLGGGEPQINAELVLEQVRVGSTSVGMERQSIALTSSGVELDLALRAAGASESIQIRGSVPTSLQEPLDLVVEARGDSLGFLAPLASPDLAFERGSTTMRLLLRGVLEQPEANGFLLVRDGAVQLAGQSFRDVNAALLFDFNRLEVSQLEAALGSGGQLTARGGIGLFRPSDELQPLTIRLVDARIRQSIVDVAAEGEVVVLGALNQPELSGRLSFRDGLIQPRSGFLARLRRGLGSGVESGATAADRPADVAPVDLTNLVDSNWDFQEPLVLFGPGAERTVRSAGRPWLPTLPAIRFRNFRLGLGPNLQMQMPPLISFSGGGQLLLNGPLDPSLQVRGLLRFQRGRVSLFSTTFRLDGQAANVAVFTPSLGLVPFVDVAMKSRVSDSVQQGGDGRATTSNIFDTNGLGAIGEGVGRLRLVKVTVLASGLADRLVGSLTLRSSPPMSESQLLSLIGGNSLSGLASAGGTALATVVGQSLLSPVLGTLTDVMGQRLQIALFPTYITPEVKDASERTSGQVAPTFTLVTELGLDVTDRFDFSVLAAPNTTDVPPQATVTYRVTPSTSISGSMDANGTWQSRLQLFLRF